MKTGSRLFRWPFLALCMMGIVVALSSCSKKDVKQDEPAINPSAGDTSGGTTGSGDVSSSQTSGELQTVYFDFDSYRVTNDGRSALKANADWLKANPTAEVQIEGHCDERGTVEYNLALGERRAAATRSYLQKMGIAKKRISTISYGKERPEDPGHDESAWSKNRRASFVITTR
jgi:peptidoglycan-associated lipoprotein